MPTARAVGRAYAELETLAMKRLIDNGYALPLNESLALELDQGRTIRCFGRAPSRCDARVCRHAAIIKRDRSKPAAKT
jgi:hypothetical protein